MTRTMTRSFTSVLPLHYSHVKPEKQANTPSESHTLTHSLTHNFDSIQSAEMSVMTILLAEFKKKSFVHFSSLLTTIAAACQNHARFLTRSRSTACSLDYHFLTMKIVIL